MNGSKIAVLGAIITAAGVLVLQYREGISLRDQNDLLRRQLADFSELQTDNSRLSNSVEHANGALSQEDMSELLKLRNEVTQLRQRTNELAALRQQNEKLRASLTNREASQQNPSAKKMPPDALPQDIHPRETWGFRGYSSPDSTIESVVWAMKNGDKATFIAGFVPEMVSELESISAGKDFVQDHMKENTKISEFRILNRQVLSDDEIIVTIYTNKGGNDDPEDTLFKKIDGQWKVAGPPKK